MCVRQVGRRENRDLYVMKLEKGAVWYGSTLFAMLYLLESLGSNRILHNEHDSDGLAV